MTTATAHAQDRTYDRSNLHFVLRRMHSLTGLLFGGYLIVHLIVNATIAQGGSVYQDQVNKIHSLPFLPLIEWGFIFLPLLFHTAYGIFILLSGRPNVTRYGYVRNWNYLLQRISAIIIVLFVAFHVLSFKYGLFSFVSPALAFDPHRALPTVVEHMNVSALIPWVIYPLGILASCFHLANGFYTAAITWGLTVSSHAQRRWGMLCIGLFALTLVAGMVSLVAASGMSLESANATLAPQSLVPHSSR